MNLQSYVGYLQRYSHVLWVCVLVPNEKFCTSGNIIERSVVNFLVILKSEKILFPFVSRAANKTHPAGSVLVFTINVVWQFTVLVNLEIKTVFGLVIQWNPVNTDTKGACQSVCTIRMSVLSELSEYKVKDTCFIDKKIKADIFMGTKYLNCT